MTSDEATKLAEKIMDDCEVYPDRNVIAAIATALVAAAEDALNKQCSWLFDEAFNWTQDDPPRLLAPDGHILDDTGTVRKVLGTLPVTADECVAGKGAKLFPLHPIDLGDDDEDAATLELSFYVVPPEGGRLDEDDEAEIGKCYSTEAAAKLAQQEKAQ